MSQSVESGPLLDAVADVFAAWGVRSRHGEWSDRETQMHAAREVLRLLPPEPDNHHNAALCPYCTTPIPPGEVRRVNVPRSATTGRFLPSESPHP